MGKLDGKVAIVTGGARGLGRAYAHRLASLGAKIAVSDIDLRSYTAFDGEAGHYLVGGDAAIGFGHFFLRAFSAARCSSNRASAFAIRDR